MSPSPLSSGPGDSQSSVLLPFPLRKAPCFEMPAPEYSSLASNRSNRNLSLQGFFSPLILSLGRTLFLCLVLPEIAHSNLLFSETRKASWHRVSLSCCANVSFALRKEANYTMHHTVRFAKRGRKGKRGGRTGFQHARFNDFGKLSTWSKKKNLNLTVSQ